MTLALNIVQVFGVDGTFSHKKSPVFCEKSHVFHKKSLICHEECPICCGKSPVGDA